MISDPNSYLQSMIDNFKFIYFSKDTEKAQEKLKNVTKDYIIIIHYQETDEYGKSFFVLFDKTVIIIPKIDFPQIFQQITKKDLLTIFYTTTVTKNEIEETFKDQIKFESIHYPTINYSSFLSQCPEVKTRFFQEKQSKLLLKTKLQMIITYILQKSLINTRINRLDNVLEMLDKKPENKEFDIKEFIILSNLGRGSSSYVQVAFHIGTEKLFALKYNFSENNNYKRELYNYRYLSHPFIPRFYGTIQSQQIFVMDYIEGQSLLQIKEMNLSIFEKFMIILEIMFTFHTLHEKKFVYRDLHPKNVILDSNKAAVLIDFDRMIIQNNNGTDTVDFCHQYIAPEILQKKKFSFEADIYSIGLLIYFIILEKEPIISYDEGTKYPKYLPFNDLHSKYPLLQEICEKCTLNDPKKRYNINELIIKYSYDYLSTIFIDFSHYFNDQQIKTFFKLYRIIHPMPVIDTHEILKFSEYQKEHCNSYTLVSLGKMYLDGIEVPQDINQSIHYLTLASNKNNPEAQYILGLIYYEGKYVSRKINKSIYYFTLASNQNHKEAQFSLGYIYYTGKYTNQDIDKGIYYFTLAANNNHSQAQYLLGDFYLFNLYDKEDMNKSIYYLTLSSNQNNPQAQFLLGKIYLEIDISKAVYYLTLSANNNHYKAQSYLGQMYYDGDRIPVDLNKAIHYLTLSANQNSSDAQYLLGKYFYEGEKIQRDINKAIYYLILSSNQKNSDAQLLLGYIYYEDEFVKRDIKKAIYYLALSSNSYNSEAFNLLGQIYYEGEDIPRDIKRGIHYLNISSKYGNSNAQCYLGLVYSSGKYIAKDINKAIHYFTLSANQNHPTSQFMLGNFYYYGKYVKRNVEQGIRYLMLSANQNNSNSQYLLGQIYYDGEYVEKNINKAMHFLLLSSNKNNPCAQYLLGRIYFIGKYICRDIKKSIDYFKLSASQGDIDSQFYLGFIYFFEFNGKYIDQAIHYLTLSASKYHPSSCFMLGSIYSQKYSVNLILKRQFIIIKMDHQ